MVRIRMYLRVSRRLKSTPATKLAIAESPTSRCIKNGQRRLQARDAYQLVPGSRDTVRSRAGLLDWIKTDVLKYCLKSMADRNRSRAGVPRDATEARILETAGHVFAETGFQAAKVRDICRRAGVNLAAVNYHFGDKLGLYKEVLRYAACAAGNAASFNPVLPGRTPEAKLRAFVHGLLQHMYGEERPAWPVRLMTHELAQPTPAFEAVVDQVIRPRHEAIRGLVGGLIGRPADDRQTRLCAQSIMGQIIIYAHGREVLKRLWPDLRYTPDTLAEIAGHIASFSFAALKSLGRRNAAAKPKQKQTAR